MNSNSGYAGLFNGANLAQQSKDNLVVAEQLSNFTDKKRKEQEEDQAKVAAMQEEIKKQTDQLLGYDKKKLNEARKGAFSLIRNEIVANGGDYSRFMANGGRAILDNYKNSVLNSDAMISFQENQKNMSTILELEKKGMGHLINPVDRANMESYRRNKGGKITYTGQLMDIKLPDGKDYDWDTDVPAEDILRHDGNYTKIMNNYAMSFPHLKQPPSPQDLKTYVKSLYSVRGSDWSRGANQRDFNYKEKRDGIDDDYRERRFGWEVNVDNRDFKESNRRWDVEQEAKADAEKNSLLEQMMKANGMNADGTVTGSKGSETPEESFVSNVGALNEYIDNSGITVAQWNKGIWNDTNRPETQDGFDDLKYGNFNLKSDKYDSGPLSKNMSPKNAKFITNLNASAAASAALGDGFVEGNKIKGVVTKDQNWFGSNGMILSGNTTTAYDFWRGKKPRDFNIKGVATVATYSDVKGNKNILMQKHNNFGGGVDTSYEKELSDRVKKSKVKMEQMVVAQDPDSGELVYIPFDTNNSVVRTSYADKAKGSDNITNQIKTYSNKTKQKNDQKKKTENQLAVERETYQSFVNDTSSNNRIKTKSSIIGNPTKPGLRIPLLSSFYATLASMGQDATIYSKSSQGQDFEDMLRKLDAKHDIHSKMKDSNYKNQEIIRILQRADSDGNQSEFYENWIKNYQNLNNM